mgnify:CR=1 FL=1
MMKSLWRLACFLKSGRQLTCLRSWSFMISKFVNSSINEMSLNLLILQSSISFKFFRSANSCKLLFEFQRSANFSKFILYKNEKSVSLIPLKDNDLSLGSWLMLSIFFLAFFPSHSVCKFLYFKSQVQSNLIPGPIVSAMMESSSSSVSYTHLTLPTTPYV